jgi:spermidine synthase
MVPRILIDSAPVPGGGELRLFQRGDEFSIMLGANELMNSRLSGSEEALATLVCDRLGGKTAPRLLIGGLGMGFTLRAALGRLGADAAVTVAELVPAVVAWARGPMAPIFGDCLEDSRALVAEEDVGALIAGERGVWDAILLDVDNGPDGLPPRQRSALQRLRPRRGAIGVEVRRCTGGLVGGARCQVRSAAGNGRVRGR